jgi:hypothetical protein
MAEGSEEEVQSSKLTTTGEFLAETEQLLSTRSFFSWRTQASLWFWLLGWLLDEKHKPSISRMMLTFWTWVGYKAAMHEIGITAIAAAQGVHLSGVPLSNAFWTAWWAAEGVLTVAVFGPRVASYFQAGAAGAVAMTSIGAATRDKLDVFAARDKANASDKEGGSEYTH